MINFRSNIAIALGGNLPFQGAPTATLMVRAIRDLGVDDVVIRAVSRFFSTPCFPAGAGPDYVNAAILVDTPLSPDQLLQRLHGIESEFGRARVERWGGRTLDLDLLVYDQQVLPDLETQTDWMSLSQDQQRITTPDRLVLPHPRLQDRAFALVPLADIAPDWVHPVLRKSVRELCAALPAEDVAAVRAL